jgi:AcrR family transcriptional regulator
MMKQEKSDRRSRRTRQLLSDALTALMLEKRYDKITVQDVIDRANVGRSTFYAHFQDKEDLLLSHFGTVLDALIQHFDLQPDDPEQFMPVRGLFRHAQAFYPVYQTFVWGRGVELLYKQGQAHLSQRIEENLAASLPVGQPPAVPLPVLSNHIAATLTSLLRWWLENEMPYTAEEMDGIFQQLVLPTVRSVLITT